MECGKFNDAAELAAAVNAVASMAAKGKSVEEIELMAVLFDLLSDTLSAIAEIEDKRGKLRERRDEVT